MQPKYKVLERFSEQTRRKVAERVFDRVVQTYPYRYACADGVCIMAALLEADGLPMRRTHPDPEQIARKLGTRAMEAVCEIAEITYLNDTGQLATPEAVRELLGVPTPRRGTPGARRDAMTYPHLFRCHLDRATLRLRQIERRWRRLGARRTIVKEG
jgi:hypothetical protein